MFEDYGELGVFVSRALIIIIAYVVLNLILDLITNSLRKRATTKRIRSNIKIFSKIIHYAIIIVLVLYGLFSYSDGLTGFGLSLGLMSAALGWALQRPITGIAGWIMLIIKRPFEIGDRVIIGSIKGDVVDMTITHVYINEVGGTIAGEENSGRITMVPNSKLFEQNIVNYTAQDKFILKEVIATVTFESNVDKAVKIAMKAAEKYSEGKKKPYVYTFFNQNGISIHIRFFAPAIDVQAYKSKVSKEFYDGLKKSKDIVIAYPQMEVKVRK